MSVEDWDLFHITTGASFRIWRLALTAGVGYVYGGSISGIDINFVNPHENNLLKGESVREHVKYRAIKLIFGLEFGAKSSSK